MKKKNFVMRIVKTGPYYIYQHHFKSGRIFRKYIVTITATNDRTKKKRQWHYMVLSTDKDSANWLAYELWYDDAPFTYGKEKIEAKQTFVRGY